MVSKPNLSLEAYQILDSVPLYLVPILLSLFLLLPLVTILLLPIKLEWAMKVFSAMNSFYHSITTAIFGPPSGVINFEQARSTSSHTTYIGRRKVKKITHALLAGFGLSFLLNIAIVFWDIFLFTESYTCDDSLDCFAVGINFINESGNISAVGISYTPVSNCSADEDESLAIICYEFTFSFGTGLAAVGGMYSALQIIPKIISVSVLKVYSTCIPYKKFMRISSHTIVHIMAVILVTVCCIVSIIFYILNMSVFELSSIFQFFAIVFTIWFGFAIPWYNLTEDVPEGQNSTERTTEGRPLLSSGQPDDTNYGGTGTTNERINSAGTN